MMGRLPLYIIIVLFLSALLFHCGTEKDDVLLRLKFKENQKVSWKADVKRMTKIYEDDSLVYNKELHSVSKAIEEVIEVIDSAASRIRLTEFYEHTKPDERDSTTEATVVDSYVVEYVQNDRGVTLEFQFVDKYGPELSEYYQKLNEQMAPRYPDVPVQKGYSWSNSIKVMLQDNEVRNATSTFRVRDFVREAGYDCAVIEFEGNAIVPYKGKREEEDVTEIRVDKIFNEGVFYLAYREGIIIRHEYKFEFNGEGVKIKDGKEINLRVLKKGTDSYIVSRIEGI